MPAKSVFCIASAESQALELLQNLKRIGIPSRDISVLVADKTGPWDFAYECRNKSSEGAVLGGLLAGGTAASLGWLAGLGVLPLGTPAWTATGPALCSLSAASIGTLAGAIIGGAFGLARHEYVARRFNGKLPEASFLVSVHCQDRSLRQQIISIFKQVGAHDIDVCHEVDTGEPAAAGSPMTTS